MWPPYSPCDLPSRHDVELEAEARNHVHMSVRPNILTRSDRVASTDQETTDLEDDRETFLICIKFP